MNANPPSPHLKLFLFALAPLFHGPVASAQELDLSSDDELLGLLDVIEEETKQAKKNRLNADYVPGILTVLRGDELELLGVKTVWEALDYMPGVYTSYNNFGEMQVVVRGMGTTVHNSYVKILLNDISIHTTAEQRMAVLSIPVEQVDRMEIVRGSGSPLHGEGATAAAINIITKKDVGNRVYAGTGKFDSNSGGIHFYEEIEGLGMVFYGNFALAENNFSGLERAIQIQGPGNNTVSHPIDDRQKSLFGLFGVEYKDTTFLWQLAQRQSGEFYGTGSTPSLRGDPMGTDRHSIFTFQHKENLFEDIEATFEVNFQDHDFSSPLHGTLSPAPPPGIPPGPGNYSYNRRIHRIQRWEPKINLEWDRFEKHDLLLGFAYSNQEVTEAYALRGSHQGGTTREDTYLPLGETRDSFSTVIQDIFSVNDKLDLTASARYDKYSDMDSNTSYRVAAVYRARDNHIFKAQYAEAYRPPSFIERYESITTQTVRNQAESLVPEEFHTSEFGYIYRDPTQVVRLTIFHQDIEDLISSQVPIPGVRHPFYNKDLVENYGIEAEWHRTFNRNWRLATNVSFVETDDTEDNIDVPGAAKWLANIALIHNFTPKITGTARWRHVGDIARFAGDTRGDMEGYDTLDLTLDVQNFWRDGFHFQVGVQNATDEDVRNLSNASSIVFDLPRTGATWWTKVSYSY